jgi:hypothetical protein
MVWTSVYARHIPSPRASGQHGTGLAFQRLHCTGICATQVEPGLLARQVLSLGLADSHKMEILETAMQVLGLNFRNGIPVSPEDASRNGISGNISKCFWINQFLLGLSGKRDVDDLSRRRCPARGLATNEFRY